MGRFGQQHMSKTNLYVYFVNNNNHNNIFLCNSVRLESGSMLLTCLQLSYAHMLLDMPV